jgi:hypothetical protein
VVSSGSSATFFYTPDYFLISLNVVPHAISSPLCWFTSLDGVIYITEPNLLNKR